LDDIPQRCRDPKDDYLLELAIKSKAIYLVSGDDDLLDIGEIEGCRIMTFSRFLQEVGLF
jgi:predicted nucleic acid-binding protein